MGTIAARKARMILDNAQKVIGIELFAASQALYLRGDDKLAPATKAVYNKIRESVAPIHDDSDVRTDEQVRCNGKGGGDRPRGRKRLRNP